MPHPEGRKGRPPFPVEMLLRIHFMQQWFTLSDPAMEEALHDMPLFRDFVGLSWDSATPDESTILRFRNLLEVHKLAEQILKTAEFSEARDRTRCKPDLGSWHAKGRNRSSAFPTPARQSFPKNSSVGPLQYGRRPHAPQIQPQAGSPVPQSLSAMLARTTQPLRSASTRAQAMRSVRQGQNGVSRVM